MGSFITIPAGLPLFSSQPERRQGRKLSSLVAVLVAAAVVLAGGYGLVNRFSEEEQLYREYYDYYYSHLIRTRSETESAQIADTYARHYARYYTSDAYRNSLVATLPEADTASMAYPANSPNASMRISAEGLALIKSYESFRPEPYFDSGGMLTVGYGHLVRKHKPIARLTEAQAERVLAQDVRVAEAVVKREVDVKLTQTQFSALVSLVYNIGPSAFAESTMLKKLNKGNFKAASQEFGRWKFVDRKHSKGLARRRVAEEAMFRGTAARA